MKDILRLIGIKKNKIAPWSKYYEKEDMELNIPNTNVYKYFENKVLNYNDKKCIDYYGYKVKYSELLTMIDDLAKGLYEEGVRKGDIVSVCLPNTIEGITSFFAINKIGAVINFIHPAASEEEIKDSLNETNSKVLLIIDSNFLKLKSIEKKININKIILVNIYGYTPSLTKIRDKIDETVEINLLKSEKKYILWNFFLIKAKKKKIDNYIAEGEKEAPAMILHSGGTTGTPKGVVLTNSNLLAYVEISMNAQKYLVSGDVFLTIMPIFHGFGIIYSVLFPLCIGMYIVLRPKFDAKEYCKLIKKYKPQVITGVPTLFESLLKEWDDKEFKLDFLKCALVGGDTLKPLLRKRINSFFKKHGSDVRVLEGYGLSEAVCGVVQGIKEFEKEDTIGIPLPGINVGIFDMNNKEVAYGQEGEICVCGPTVMKGYYNNQEETDLVLKIHKDGNLWLHTGDLGLMDEDGFVTYTSRLKRMIISSGYNVYPNRIEKIIESHPSVLRCTVVGVPHNRKIEVAKAFIILKKDKTKKDFIIMDLKKLCKKNLPKYSWPYEYEFVDELPTTRVGKVDFRKLQEGNKEE